MQWRVRTGITSQFGFYDLLTRLVEAGYDLTTLPNDGYTWSNNILYSKWSDWVSFPVGDYEPEPTYSANVTIVSPSGGEYGGANTIHFIFEIESQANEVEYVAEYTADNGVTWKYINYGVLTPELFRLDTPVFGGTFPEGTIKWHVKARANGDWSTANASFTVTYDGYGQITVASGPAYKATRGDQPILVQASLTTVGQTWTPVHLKEATFCWRSSENNSFAEIAMQPYTGTGGYEYELRLESYTLPYGPIQWYLKGKDTKDVETETERYDSYILRSKIDSIALSPSSTIENAETEIMFKWACISDVGHIFNKAEIQFSEDGVSWGTPVPVDSPVDSTVIQEEIPDSLLYIQYMAIKTYKFSSEYFSPGQIYWRVRCYDVDDDRGAWSTAVSFICYGIPKVRNLVCDEKPFATLTWSATGQVSYEIKIDNQLYYGPFHGTDGHFILPEPLEDGTHTIAVQVQNNLSLLTPWTEITVEIENVPSEAGLHELIVSGDIDASISWKPLSVRQGDGFLLYRDNVLIKKFASDIRSYTDRLVLGLHIYRVIQHMPDGYYNQYTYPAVFLSTDETKIALFDGGAWFALELTTERYPTNTFKQTKITEKTKIMGASYPVVEVSNFEELSAQYEVVWPFEEREKAYRFKSFFGKAVIIKSRGEQVICGVLDGYEMSVNSQTVGFTFTIEQMSIDENISLVHSGDAYEFNYVNLDRILFGEMTSTALDTMTPGTTDPQHYEAIADAINALKRAIEGTT